MNTFIVSIITVVWKRNRTMQAHYKKWKKEEKQMDRPHMSLIWYPTFALLLSSEGRNIFIFPSKVFMSIYRSGIRITNLMKPSLCFISTNIGLFYYFQCGSTWNKIFYWLYGSQRLFRPKMQLRLLRCLLSWSCEMLEKKTIWFKETLLLSAVMV